MPLFAVGGPGGTIHLGHQQETPMDSRDDRQPAAPHAPEDRLDSWKEIAVYLSRDVTTVQRWEKREGMPVHRHRHDRMGSVYAFRRELDAWARSRHVQPSVGTAPARDERPDPPALAFADRVASRWRVLLLMAATLVLIAAGVGAWLRATELFWRNPIADARFERLTDFDGVVKAAAVSRDGRVVAFLSDRGGQPDVWVTQVGSGQFSNLTRGRMPELENTSVRSLAFTPDGSLVTFWVRRADGARAAVIGTWAVPTLGGDPRPFLDGAAEADWSSDGTQLVYHTAAPGDPTFVTDAESRARGRPVFTAESGLHAHFPLWSPDGAFIYFVKGSPPDRWDIWRVAADGSGARRITSHESQVSHPVFVAPRTLLYLASEADGSGPWLYGMDVDHLVPHRLSTGVDRYTSLSASADGRRLVTTIASPRWTLWRVPVSAVPATAAAATPVSGTSLAGTSPRLGPGYLVYVVRGGAGDSLWKVVDGAGIQVWSAGTARVLGGPAVSPDGALVAFSVRERGQARLFVVRADGTGARVVTDLLDLQGAPAWDPDGRSVVLAALEHGVPCLFKVPIDGGAPSRFLNAYATDPAWAPDGRFVAYTGPDVGTTFAVRAVTRDATAHPLPDLALTRGARHVVFLPGTREVAVLRGGIEHKNVWLVNLETGAARQLTDFAAGFQIRDFDVSRDGRELVVERVQERSDVVLLDLHPTAVAR
jgi:Tol biopolymer transport system component